MSIVNTILIHTEYVFATNRLQLKTWGKRLTRQCAIFVLSVFYDNVNVKVVYLLKKIELQKKTQIF